MADYGIKVSKPGFDILTADLKDQIFNSSANSLKIWMEGNVSFALAAGDFPTANTNVSHGLGYSPFYLVYFKLANANKLWFQDSLDTDTVLDFFSGQAYSNDTNLNVAARFNDFGCPGFTIVAYYKILIDKAYE